MQPWKHETDGLTIRRVGKLNEELAELSKVASRIIIQGIDSLDPKSKKSNRESITEEIADVMAQCQLCVEQLNLDYIAIEHRIDAKKKRMEEWELVLKEEL